MGTSKRRANLVEKRVDTTHYRYRIVGGRRDGTCQAIAYLGRRKVHAAAGEDVTAAVDSLKSALDEHIDRLAQDRADGVPTDAEFREAFLVLAAGVPNETMKLLMEHGRLPGGGATLAELARRTERDEAATVADYVRIGRKLTSLLGFAPRQDGLERSLAPILTFAFVETPSGSKGTILRLRPEVVAALAAADSEIDTARLRSEAAIPARAENSNSDPAP